MRHFPCRENAKCLPEQLGACIDASAPNTAPAFAAHDVGHSIIRTIDEPLQYSNQPKFCANPVKPESIVKEMVVALGFRHKNKPVELRSLGNIIDTTRRRATFRFAVRWDKAPSRALIEDMREGVRPLRPTSQTYAGDVDFIDIQLELIAPPVIPAG